MPWDDELQVYAPNQNENVYTNNWRGPLFGTFTHVLDTYALTETPRRLKPVNLYYHFYSGDYLASIHALETIYDWVMVQPLHALSVSNYARIARDARGTAIFSAGPDRWLVVNRGESRTLRLPAALANRLDLARSPGLTGWKADAEQAYLHTSGASVATIALAPQPAPHPRLESSSAEISFRVQTAATCTFSVRDLRPVNVVFAGLTAGATVRASINAQNQVLTATPAGTLALALPTEAEVTLDFTAQKSPSAP